MKNSNPYTKSFFFFPRVGNVKGMGDLMSKGIVVNDNDMTRLLTPLSCKGHVTPVKHLLTQKVNINTKDPFLYFFRLVTWLESTTSRLRWWSMEEYRKLTLPSICTGLLNYAYINWDYIWCFISCSTLISIQEYCYHSNKRFQWLQHHFTIFYLFHLIDSLESSCLQLWSFCGGKFKRNKAIDGILLVNCN